MLSITLDISARRIVIVGGGKVAARKAAAVLVAGAGDVTVVSPAFIPEFPNAVKRIISPYDAMLLTGADLVFAATDNAEVNAAVVRDAHAIGALVNRADTGDDAGDFTLPAALDRGDIRVTISTGSPALSTAIRDKLASEWDDRYTALAAAMKTLRPWIVAQSQLSAGERMAIFRDLTTDAALQHAADPRALTDWLLARHAQLSPPATLEPQP